MTAMLSEAQLHRAVAEYLALALPAESLDCFWTTFPAGGGGVIRGKILRGLGLKPGVPDIFLAWWDGEQSRIGWIELKSEKGRVSPEQIEMQRKLSSLSHDHAICRSLDSVYRCLLAWRVPIRAHLTIAQQRGQAA